MLSLILGARDEPSDSVVTLAMKLLTMYVKNMPINQRYRQKEENQDQKSRRNFYGKSAYPPTVQLPTGDTAFHWKQSIECGQTIAHLLAYVNDIFQTKPRHLCTTLSRQIAISLEIALVVAYKDRYVQAIIVGWKPLVRRAK